MTRRTRVKTVGRKMETEIARGWCVAFEDDVSSRLVVVARARIRLYATQRRETSSPCKHGTHDENENENEWMRVVVMDARARRRDGSKARRGRMRWMGASRVF